MRCQDPEHGRVGRVQLVGEAKLVQSAGFIAHRQQARPQQAARRGPTGSPRHGAPQPVERRLQSTGRQRQSPRGQADVGVFRTLQRCGTITGEGGRRVAPGLRCSAVAHQLARRGRGPHVAAGNTRRLARPGRGQLLQLSILNGQQGQAVFPPAGAVRIRAADLARPDHLPALVDAAAAELGGLDALVNNAGVLDFAPLDQERPADIELTFRVNVLAPVLLARAALPHLRRSQGRILNVGSIFGSIAFPWFATYSASKFAIRGFSEALRRELHGSGVGVTYVAPRATRTPLASLFGRMAEATHMPMDPPERVAAAIARALERDADDVYLGGPEPFFVRLNGLLPRLVDRALRKQGAAMQPFAVEAALAREAAPAKSGKEAPCAT